MRPPYRTPSARLIWLGAMLYAPLTVPHPPIIATTTKPDTTAAEPMLDLADVKPVEPKKPATQTR